MSTSTPEQIAHARTVQQEIDSLISSMTMTYDAKTLAVMFLARSVQLLRAVHTTKLWTVEDVRAVIEECMKDVYKPLPKEETPRVATIGGTTSTRPS